jgi:large subunit ribosomal protein L16
VSLNKTITSKPKGVRMGKGKGSINQSVCYISRGEIVFELSQINKLVMIDAFNAASAKLPIPTQALSL